MRQPTEPIKLLLTALQRSGYDSTESRKIVDAMLGELCVKYEKLRANSDDEVIDRIYRGGPFNRADNYFHEKWGKFINQGYAFACYLDGGNLPRLGMVLREYIDDDGTLRGRY